MASPVRMYAGTQEGLFVWRSRNGSWEKVSVAFATGTIDSIDGLKTQPNVVFLGVTQDGLYRTDDAGKSWQRVFEGNVRAVTVDPTNEEVVYVGINRFIFIAARTVESLGRSSPAFRNCPPK